MPRKSKHVGRTLEKEREELLREPEFALEWDRQMQVAEIAKLLKALRKESKLTQTELALLAGLQQSVVARLETGDLKRRPKLDTLAVIARACGRRLVLNFI